VVAEMAGNLARRAAPSAVMSVVFITTAAWAWRANTGAAGGGDEAVRELGEGQPLGASDLQELTAQRRVVDGEVDDGGDIASGDEANGVAAGAGGGVQHRHQHHVLGAGGGGRLDQGPVAVAVDGLGAGPAGSGEPVHGRDHRRTATDRRGDRGRVAHVAGEGLDRAEQLRRAGRSRVSTRTGRPRPVSSRTTWVPRVLVPPATRIMPSPHRGCRLRPPGRCGRRRRRCPARPAPGRSAPRRDPAWELGRAC